MDEAVLDDAADWLERILQQELKQEVDQEDMVVRTLPVFIAAIGVMLAFVGLVLQKLPKLSGDPLIFVTYCGLFSLVLLIAAVIGILIYALRDRTVFRPLGGRRLADYVDSLRDFHADAGTAAEVETRVLADVRATQCDQLAYSIAANREINDRRRQARGAAFTILLAALILVLAMLSAHLIGIAIGQGGRLVAEDRSTGATQPAASQAEAGSAADAGDPSGAVHLP